MRWIIGLLALPWLADLASAEECKPLRLVNKIQMVPGLNEIWEVPASINGQDARMKLGFQASVRMLDEKTRASLDLPKMKGNIAVRSLSGVTSNDVVKIRSLKFGAMEIKDAWLVVAPDDLGDNGDANGLIGRDILMASDMDVDLGTGVLSLFASDHCPESVGFWAEPPPSTAISFEGVGLTVPVSVDGKPLEAVLSTNSYSTMTQGVALRVFGIDVPEAGLVPAPNSVGEAPLMGFYHTFSSLSFGGVTVKNMNVFIAQDGLGRANDLTTGRLPPRFVAPGIFIGMNVLKYLHINIAPRAKMLYVSGTSAARGK